MNIYSRLSIITALVLTPASYAQASGVSCDSGPKSHWMSKDKIAESLKSEGYKIRKIEVEDGCYEVYAMKDGKKLEIFVNPKTGKTQRKIVK